jgi:RNA polymerase sigma factor for flagellar operon FliA
MKAYAQQLEAPAQSMLDDREIARLVESYIPLVLHQVDRAWLSPRLGLTREDLVSAGCYGLLLAARKFDPSRGVGFGVFARTHVHGALMREIQTAMKASGVGTEEVLAGSEEIEPDSLPDERSALLADSAETAQVRELMELSLTERERLLVTLYYYEELTLAEIAAVVDESESAVSRALNGAIAQLRAALKDRKGETEC